ncbi:MAG: SUMF1/EgtB/PvdO family nonheme iron enzyme [Bacteroidota bacterium]
MPTCWGISIGINGYKFSHLTPLKYAKSDAELFADFLKQDARFDEVIVFSDDSPPVEDIDTTPCRTPLRQFFRNQFETRFLSTQDSLWLFFSGHGIRHNEADYVLPMDGDPEDPKETGISLEWITQRLRRSGAGDIVLILDTCRTTGQKGSFVESMHYSGVTTIFSCKPNEASWEIDAVTQGAFTFTLLKIFKQQIKLNAFETIANTEKILQKEIRSLNCEYGKYPQTPHIKCDSVAQADYILFTKLLRKASKDSENSFYHASQSSYRNHITAEHDSSTLSVKSKALQAEEDGNYQLALDLWKQVVSHSTSEQSSYDAAIQRIKYLTESTAEKITSKRGNNSTSENSKLQQKIVERLDRPIVLNKAELKEYKHNYIKIDRTKETAKEFARTTYQFKENSANLDIDMVYIPKGDFFMGSSEKRANPTELPRHKVSLEPFFMSKFPVTKKQWKLIAEQRQIKFNLKLRPSLRGSDSHPVVEISWYDAVEFCERLSKVSGYKYRLPSEAEWEYACRAGSNTLFHFGRSMNKEVANFGSSSSIKVNRFPYPNAFGIYAMHGNVWEWCADRWHNSYEDAPADGTTWIGRIDNGNRVLRGGSWKNEPKLCRSACRMFDSVDTKANNIGLRIVRSV